MKRFALAAVATLGGFGVAVACGEPYDGEIPAPAEAGVDANDDASPSSDAGITDPDAPPPIDATSDAPAVDANCNRCDCDGDGFVTYDAAVCPDAGGRPRADCDDLDVRANPDAGFAKDLPTVTTKGDWNCDTTVQLEGKVGVKCVGLLSTSCDGIAGFTGDPACGELGMYVTCKLNGFSCEVGTAQDIVQRCE